ncbi:MAG TPA: hypothetical protein VGL88_13180 [Pseudonocardiaceae bacterium]
MSEQHCIHLLEAERDLLADCHRHRTYLGLCGEVLPVSKLPSSDCGSECDCEIICEAAAGALEQPDRAPGEYPLPAGGVHLLAADEVVGQGYGTSSQVTLCGELVGASELSPWLCSLDRDEHRYCPACVREAIRWKADSAAHIVAQLEQLRELVARDG